MNLDSGFLSTNISMASTQALQGKAKTLDQMKTSGDMKKIEEAAREFESVFIAEMLKPMFDGIEADAPFNGGKGEEVFQSFLLQEYGKGIAQTGTIGLADHVKQELINLQEQTSHETIPGQ